MGDHTSNLEEVFNAAWEQVRAGRSVEAVLADYPQDAAALEPLLRTGLAVRALPRPAPSAEALARIAARAQAAAAAQRPAAAPAAAPSKLAGGVAAARPAHRPAWLPPWATPLRLAAATLAVLLIAGALIAGDALLSLRPGLPPLVSYVGQVKTLAPAQWIIDDRTVLVDPATVVNGRPWVGATVKCIGAPLSADGTRLRAVQIWVQMTPGATFPPEGPHPVPTLPWTGDNSSIYP